MQESRRLVADDDSRGGNCLHEIPDAFQCRKPARANARVSRVQFRRIRESGERRQHREIQRRFENYHETSDNLIDF